MKIGMVGLGRTGSNMVRRLLGAGHECVAHDIHPQAAADLSDSGEGRWTLKAAIDEGVPAPILSAALAQRFASRGDEDFANKVLSALRYEFGGHEEKH